MSQRHHEGCGHVGAPARFRWVPLPPAGDGLGSSAECGQEGAGGRFVYLGLGFWDGISGAPQLAA